MPQQTHQANAISAALSVANLMSRLASIHDDVNAFLIANANQTYDATWQALPTAPWNTDGTIGSTDGTPNNAHPITAPTGAPLLMARNDLLTGLGCLTNFATFMTGGAIAQQVNTPRKFSDLLNK